MSSGPSRAVSADAALDLFHQLDDATEPLTATEVAEELECARRTAYNKLSTLAEQGELKTKKVGSRGRVWWLLDQAKPGADPASSDSETFANLNSVMHETIRNVVQAENRTEVEQHVCDLLVETGSYLFTVTGEFSSTFESFSRRTWAGVDEEYLDVIFHPREGPTLSEGKGAEAARTGEIQVQKNVREAEYECWDEDAGTRDVQSYAAVPFAYEGRVYGVLGIFAAHTEAFDTTGRQLLSDLGEIVGYAIAELTRTEIREHRIELEFESKEMAQPFHEVTEGQIEGTLDTIVPIDEGEELQYWTVGGIPANALQNAAEALEAVYDVRFLSRGGDQFRIQVHAARNSVSAIFRDHGGRLKESTIDGGNLTLIGEFPDSADPEAVAADLQEGDSGFSLTAERSILTETWLQKRIEERLTERQLTSLRMAHSAGYFQQPRRSTGEELADRLGISRQTFNRHLRNAEGRVCKVLFEPTDGNTDSP